MQNIVSISLSDFPSSFVNKDVFFLSKEKEKFKQNTVDKYNNHVV